MLVAMQTATRDVHCGAGPAAPEALIACGPAQFTARGAAADLGLRLPRSSPQAPHRPVQASGCQQQNQGERIRRLRQQSGALERHGQALGASGAAALWSSLPGVARARQAGAAAEADDAGARPPAARSCSSRAWYCRGTLYEALGFNSLGPMDGHDLNAMVAAEGLRPVVAIPATLLQRAYDQLIHDVALQRLPVLFAVDRAGLGASDSAPHHGVCDISCLRCVPNLTIMTPADENECRQMLYTGCTLPNPALVPFPRAAGTGVPRAAPARQSRRPS
jgi:hypothetical protein